MALRLAVFASGGGSTLQNLLDRIAAGRLPASVEAVVSENASAYALERAKRAGVPAWTIPYSASNPEAFSERAFDVCRKRRVDLVALGGFLKLLRIPRDFEHRVMNVHPALIPAFCGKGYYGKRVHQAVLDYGVKLTGCTVHYCDDDYDHGPIILQRGVAVDEEDTAESLAARVQEAEREALPEAIRLAAEGRIEVVGRRVRVRG
jgi:phosphoribosylglycinamide formyltransferase-1